MREKRYLKISLLMVLFAFTNSLCFAIGYSFKEGGIYYCTISESEAEVAYIGDDNVNVYVGDIVIPSTATDENGVTYTVTSIHDFAFAGCEKMTSITLPNTLRTIGRFAFLWCSGLTSISIPESVTDIGKNAFNVCKNLKSVNIPNSITTLIGTFDGCESLASIDIPESVTIIGDNTFSGCALTSVTIPKGVTLIGSSAFP